MENRFSPSSRWRKEGFSHFRRAILRNTDIVGPDALDASIGMVQNLDERSDERRTEGQAMTHFARCRRRIHFHAGRFCLFT